MILDFFDSASGLKDVPRQGWIDKLSMSRPESVADHTFMMCVIGMVLSDNHNYDTTKILKMILLHDLAESQTGDLPHGTIDKNTKLELEKNALSDMLGMLPAPLQDEYEKIWQEFAMQETFESRLVRQIDKLEMALQAKRYEKNGADKAKLRPFYETARSNITDPVMLELFEKLGEDNVQR